MEQYGGNVKIQIKTGNKVWKLLKEKSSGYEKVDR